MAKYVLECPDCEARFELKKYLPEKRVRCRKCKAVVVIPYAPGDEPPAAAAPQLRPELRKKLVSALSLRKLALVSALLLMALAGASYILVKKGEARAQEAPPKPPEAMTLAKAVEMRGVLALPLKSGAAWEYSLSDGRPETRRVGAASDTVEGGPEFSLGIAGPAGAVTQTLRVLPDGIYLVAETRGGVKGTFRPPMKLLPYPLYYDDRWTYEGEYVRDGISPERWNLEIHSRNAEIVETRLEKFKAFRIETTGQKGAEKVEEVHWYGVGKGLVKRQTRLPGGALEEAILIRYTQP